MTEPQAKLERLRQAARDLENELHEMQDAETEALDDQARVVLYDALRDIQLVLESRQAEPQSPLTAPAAAENGATTPDSESLMEQLKKSAREFEGSHPTLTGILQRLVDGLGQMGI